jgi:hypothetical protein
MKHASRRPDGKTAVAILEEATYLLRANPLILTPYYIGSLPFILGLLYFWTDMSIGATAWRHCAQAAWGLVLLFIWMKTWQSVYARHLLARIRGETTPRWNLRRIWRVAGIQAAIQPWGNILLPLAFVIMLPFPQVLAFFQNATLFGSGNEADMRVVMKKSWHQAALWPLQNTLIIWLTSPFMLVVVALLVFVVVPVSSLFNPGSPPLWLFFIALFIFFPLSPLGVITALNVGMAMTLVPWLLKTLFDIETIFSISGASLLNNAFFAVVCSISYLCLDPLMKASYCLRCFYGEALHTGEDLKVEIRQLAKPVIIATMVLGLFLMGGSFSHACAQAQPQEQAVSAKKLDAALSDVISHPEYTWRMPREKPPHVAGQRNALSTFVESIIQAIQDGWKYIVKGLANTWNVIKDILSRINPSLPQINKPNARWTSFSRAWIMIPLLCIMVVLSFLAWRAWRDRRRRTSAAALAKLPRVDITHEDVDARALPEDGWLALARELMEKGELRLALRALYLATLASLAHQDLITIAKYKSDREYELELKRRAHTQSHLIGFFAENRALFESSWYGFHEVTAGILERFSNNREKIRAYAQR